MIVFAPNTQKAKIIICGPIQESELMKESLKEKLVKMYKYINECLVSMLFRMFVTLSSI